MRKDGPNEGGIASALMIIGGIELLIAFFGGALANLSLGAEIALMAVALVSACLFWAAAAVIQELRRIEFNTRREASPAAEARTAPLPTPPDDETLDRYNIKRDGDHYLFGGYCFEDAIEAVNYAKSRS